MFEKMSLKAKLALIAVVPLMVALFLGTYGAWQRMTDYQLRKHAEILVNLVVALGEVAHELQIERGLSAGFINSAGRKFADNLTSQRKRADEKVALAHVAISEVDRSGTDAGFVQMLDGLNAPLTDLEKKRQEISKLALESSASFRFYSELISQALELVVRTGNQMPTSALSRLSNTKQSLLYLKERNGQERALLTGAFSAKSMTPQQFNTLIALLGDQASFARSTRAYATPAQEKLLLDKLADPVAREVGAVEQMVRDKGANTELAYSPESWFSKITAKIDLLRVVEESYSKDILDEIRTNMDEARDALMLYVLMLAVALILTLWLSVRIVRDLMNTLGGEPAYAAEIANAMAMGELKEIQLRPHDDRSLLASMKRMVETFKGFADAQAENARQHDLGLIDHKLDADRFPGVYGQMATSINELVQSHIAVKMRVVDVVKRYARGDLSVDMEQLPGKRAEITAAMDSVKASLQMINGQIKGLVDAAAAGDFKARGDAMKFSCEFKDMIDGLNRLMEISDVGLSEVSRILDALAKGDLTQRIDGSYQGTFGKLRDDSNTTVERLREVVGGIKEATDSINTAAKEIAAGNTDLSSRTEEQASSLEETSSSMEELSSAVKQNADNARQANEQASNAQAIAARGGEVVGQVVETMGAIHQSSSKIADIIGVIDGIAFQTNILALNAAVEAARAGEQGRGFAVVATEVRNLAQRSAAAAKEIKGLISDSVGKVEVGNRLAATAGETMNEVVASIRKVTKAVTEITAASHEQSSGIEQVSKAVSQMDEVTQQNAALVEQAAAAAESLEEQADQLTRAVSAFRLTESAERGVSIPDHGRPAKLTVHHKTGRAPKPALPSSLNDEWQEF